MLSNNFYFIVHKGEKVMRLAEADFTYDLPVVLQTYAKACYGWFMLTASLGLERISSGASLHSGFHILKSIH